MRKGRKRRRPKTIEINKCLISEEGDVAGRWREWRIFRDYFELIS